jgi:anaerobic selenocysteine-containing dehydrogenase
LRQAIAQNFLYMNRRSGERLGIADKSWVWVESPIGQIRAQIKLMEGCEENTVWTWNAIGKARGTWGLSADANESNEGFLLNHLINELLPSSADDASDGVGLSNSDPITGQAAWYDLKVRIRPAEPDETGTWPTFGAEAKQHKEPASQPVVLRYGAGSQTSLRRNWKDVLFSRR